MYIHRPLGIGLLQHSYTELTNIIIIKLLSSVSSISIALIISDLLTDGCLVLLSGSISLNWNTDRA